MTEHEIFIEGWESFKKRAISAIKEFSNNWMPNGPSKITAESIIKEINRIPTPRPEAREASSDREKKKAG